MSYKGHSSFYGEIYDICNNFIPESTRKDIHRIVDLGAHYGEGYDRFGKYFKNAEYVMVEPNPACTKHILSVMERYSSRSIEHVMCVLGDTWSVCELITMSGDVDCQLSNLYIDRGDEYGAPKKVTVQVIPYSDVLTPDTDFCKISIEGAEYDLIEQPEMLNIQRFVMEVNNNLNGSHTYKDVIDRLCDKYDLMTYGNVEHKHCYISGTRI